MITLGIEIMHVWEAQFWEQSNVIWVLKLWEVTYLGSEDIMSMRMWFLCSSIKNTLLYISEIRMNFGRGNGAAWGRFGLMRDIQWSWRATLPRIFFSPRFLAILTFLAPWCFIILKLTLPWKTKFLRGLNFGTHFAIQLFAWPAQVDTPWLLRTPALRMRLSSTLPELPSVQTLHFLYTQLFFSWKLDHSKYKIEGGIFFNQQICQASLSLTSTL